jgi:drug/metabolite transporter (DMT)-like permease
LTSLSREFKGHAALSGAALIYGANYVIAKSVMPDPVGPNSFILLRVIGAAFLFWMLIIGKWKFPERKDWLRFLLCALFGVVTNQLLFFNGLALTTPIHASIIMTSNPILVMLFSSWILGIRIKALGFLGVISGSVGASGIILSAHNLSPGEMSPSSLGDIFILINSASWAMYLVLVRTLMDKYHPMYITAWVFALGIPFVIPFGGTGLMSVPWDMLSTGQWLAIIYVIVCTTFLTYLLNMYGVFHLSSSVASSYIYLQPLLAALFAWLFSKLGTRDYLGHFGWDQLIWASLIFLGIYLVGRSQSKRYKPTD